MVEDKNVGGKRLEDGGNVLKPQVSEASDPQASNAVPEDERYYVPCPARKNQARIPVVLCFDCEFATGYTFDHWPGAGKAHVDIACGFPVGRIMKKGWRRKGSNRPRVNKIERDGLS